MCCSKLSVRIWNHKEGKRIDDEGNHTFPKEEVTRRLWLSAINRDADSFNQEHSVNSVNFILKQKMSKQITLHVLALLEYVRLKPKAVHSVFVKYLFEPFPSRKKVSRFVNSHFI